MQTSSAFASLRPKNDNPSGYTAQITYWMIKIYHVLNHDDTKRTIWTPELLVTASETDGLKFDIRDMGQVLGEMIYGDVVSNLTEVPDLIPLEKYLRKFEIDNISVMKKSVSLTRSLFRKRGSSNNLPEFSANSQFIVPSKWENNLRDFILDLQSQGSRCNADSMHHYWDIYKSILASDSPGVLLLKHCDLVMIDEFIRSSIYPGFSIYSNLKEDGIPNSALKYIAHVMVPDLCAYVLPLFQKSKDKLELCCPLSCIIIPGKPKRDLSPPAGRKKSRGERIFENLVQTTFFKNRNDSIDAVPVILQKSSIEVHKTIIGLLYLLEPDFVQSHLTIEHVSIVKVLLGSCFNTLRSKQACILAISTKDTISSLLSSMNADSELSIEFSESLNQISNMLNSTWVPEDSGENTDKLDVSNQLSTTNVMCKSSHTGVTEYEESDESIGSSERHALATPELM